MKKYLIAHELGHAVCAEVQDGFWYSSGLVLERDETSLAYAWSEKLDTKKEGLKSPYVKLKQMMNLGGLFGELLYSGKWNPWGVRADIDEVVSANTSRHPLILELDDWLWRDDDENSFRFCSALSTDSERRAFTLDAHDTARRLPALWDAYLDFCDRIDKHLFCVNVDEIVKSKKTEIEEEELKEIVKEIVI